MSATSGSIAYAVPFGTRVLLWASMLKIFLILPSGGFPSKAKHHILRTGYPRATAFYSKLKPSKANSRFVLRHVAKIPFQSIALFHGKEILCY